MKATAGMTLADVLIEEGVSGGQSPDPRTGSSGVDHLLKRGCADRNVHLPELAALGGLRCNHRWVAILSSGGNLLAASSVIERAATNWSAERLSVAITT